MSFFSSEKCPLLLNFDLSCPVPFSPGTHHFFRVSGFVPLFHLLPQDLHLFIFDLCFETFLSFSVFFETGFHHVAQADLKLMILPPHLPECKNYRQVPPCPAEISSI
jgi:hypothetical protein